LDLKDELASNIITANSDLYPFKVMDFAYLMQLSREPEIDFFKNRILRKE
jgi:hypothetical protein